jgi:hypothetical protein
MKNTSIRVLLVGVAAALLALAGHAASSPAANASSNSLPAVSRAQAIARTQEVKAELLRVDRIEARLTTFGALQQAEGSGDRVTEISSTTLVWVVSTSGQFRPAFAHGNVYPWGVVVIDATSGQPIASFAGPAGNWPPFFDRIIDQAP